MKLALFKTILFTFLMILFGSFQINAQKREKCPEYMWSITYLPISYLSFEDAPAKVIYTGDGSNEVDGKYKVWIGLRNLSGKTISAVKFQWYLFPANIQLKKNIMAEERALALVEILTFQDEFSIVDLIEFQPEKELEVVTKIPCDKVSAAVANDGNTKRLAVEFVVSEISFNDGSIWKRN